MRVWRNIHRLILDFSVPISYKRLIRETYTEEEGLPVKEYSTISFPASIQPVRKKGSIGGENEIEYVFEDTGNYEQGAFIFICRDCDVDLKDLDEVEDICINGQSYGPAFVDRVQDWSGHRGLYKGRILVKSIFASRERFRNLYDDFDD